MGNKLIKDMDEETWRRFTAFCKLRGIKVSDELKDILDKFLDTQLKDMVKDIAKGGKKR